MADSYAHIPAVYRILFLWIDPFMALVGACLPCLLMPEAYCDSYLPKNISKLNPLYKVFFYQLAGMFFIVFWVQAVLLRYTDDINVWKFVNAGLLGYDFFMLYSGYFAFTSQRRNDPKTWRATDWFAVLSTTIIAGIRACIVAGVGLN